MNDWTRFIEKWFNESQIKQKGKGKHASSTESRRIVWEYIVWPLILQTNRQYFTIHEYHRNKDEFAKNKQ
jgi:hypothetical protein